MEIGSEIPQTKESYPELNSDLNYLINLGFTAAQKSFQNSYQGPKNESYQKFNSCLDQLELVFLGPDDDDPQGDRYVIREFFFNKTTGEYCINLAPLNKIDLFKSNQRKNPELDLVDGPVDECQISISRFQKTSAQTDSCLSNSGYKINILIRNYAFIENQGVETRVKPAGLGLTVLDDGSATSYLKNFIRNEFAYTRPPSGVDDSKKTQTALHYLLSLKIPNFPNNSSAATR